MIKGCRYETLFIILLYHLSLTPCPTVKSDVPVLYWETSPLELLFFFSWYDTRTSSREIRLCIGTNYRGLRPCSNRTDSLSFLRSHITLFLLPLSTLSFSTFVCLPSSTTWNTLYHKILFYKLPKIRPLSLREWDRQSFHVLTLFPIYRLLCLFYDHRTDSYHFHYFSSQVVLSPGIDWKHSIFRTTQDYESCLVVLSLHVSKRLKSYRKRKIIIMIIIINQSYLRDTPNIVPWRIWKV